MQRSTNGLLVSALIMAGGGCVGEIGDNYPSRPRGGDDDGGAGGAAGVAGAPGGSGGGGAPAAPAPPDKVSDPKPCDLVARAAKAFLETTCAGCHGGGLAAKGGFGFVLDRDKLIATGKVVPGKPDSSPIYLRTKKGEMPPAAVLKRPAAEDIDELGAWITCGAPPFDGEPPVVPPPPMSPPPMSPPVDPFIDIDTQLYSMYLDLRSIDRSERPNIRYFTLGHLKNAGVSVDELDNYRNALSVLVNSLSYGAVVTKPRAVDDAKTIYRIDLRDYDWDAGTWDDIADAYPYMVVYDDESRIYPFDEVTAQLLRNETDTDLPYIQADWFVHHASQPPLYYQVLRLSNTLGGLASSVGIDIGDNIFNEQVDRAGFNRSGVSVSNRVIERHNLDGRRGAFWLSYDFANSIGDHNIFTNPLDFQEDGGEVIFSLPNGLQAYYVANAAGTRLDKAPQAIVTDTRTPDHAVTAGLSCMGCHNERGIIQKDDEVRSFALTNLGGEELNAVLGIYTAKDEFKRLQTEDGDRFAAARRTAALDGKIAEPVVHAYKGHDDALDLARAATTFGLTKEAFLQSLNANASAFPTEIVGLRTTGATIYRNVFDDVYQDTVCALGLGQPCSFSNSDSSSSSDGFDGSDSSTSGALCGCR